MFKNKIFARHCEYSQESEGSRISPRHSELSQESEESKKNRLPRI